MLPNADIKSKPIDEQLLHIPDMMHRADPENKDALPILIFECLIMYTFILTSTPSKIETIEVKIKAITASSGK
jgi:hypothetical protein